MLALLLNSPPANVPPGSQEPGLVCSSKQWKLHSLNERRSEQKQLRPSLLAELENPLPPLPLLLQPGWWACVATGLGQVSLANMFVLDPTPLFLPATKAQTRSRSRRRDCAKPDPQSPLLLIFALGGIRPLATAHLPSD